MQVYIYINQHEKKLWKLQSFRARFSHKKNRISQKYPFLFTTRWAPTSYKWSYKPYKWPYKLVTGVITLLIGVITPFITSRGPTLYLFKSPFFSTPNFFRPKKPKIKTPSFPDFRRKTTSASAPGNVAPFLKKLFKATGMSMVLSKCIPI